MIFLLVQNHPVIEFSCSTLPVRGLKYYSLFHQPLQLILQQNEPLFVVIFFLSVDHYSSAADPELVDKVEEDVLRGGELFEGGGGGIGEGLSDEVVGLMGFDANIGDIGFEMASSGVNRHGL